MVPSLKLHLQPRGENAGPGVWPLFGAVPGLLPDLAQLCSAALKRELIIPTRRVGWSWDAVVGKVTENTSPAQMAEP